jgi:orotidine-5'-phosphate decarboxylase
VNPKSIPSHERLIFALDVSSIEEGQALAEELGEAVTFYKLGIELFMGGRYFELVEWLTARGKKVMVDLKFFDVPRTVGNAVRRLRGRGVTFATVHGNDAILEAACQEKGEVGILAVTVLTSLDQRDLEELGFQADVSAVVLSRARRALALGCDGVVSSGLEVPALRRELGHRLAVVVPGVRPVVNREVDDQKRTVDVEEAFARGADYIVVGRPIATAPDRRAAAQAIQARIAAFFAARA